MQKTKHYIGGQLSFILSGLSNSTLPNFLGDQTILYIVQLVLME